jgi:protocatechuate 3,4-dioxygenase beta subunit
VLRPMSVIRGRVVDESGKGIPDQQVNLHESPGDCLPHAWEMPRSVEEHVVFNVASDRTARTDDLGRFSFADLTAGSYFLELNSIYGPTTARWPLVSVQEGETLEDVQIILPGDLSIEGRVVDGQGRAVPKARVFVNAEIEGKRGSNALERTDTEGRFSVHHLPPGQYSVLIAPSLWNLKGEPESAFAPRKVKGVGAGTRGLEIKVGAAGWIKGRVLDSDGHYVVHAPVIITIRGDDIQTMSPTDAQGRFEFPIGEGEIADLEAQPPDVLRQEDRTDATTGRSKCARVGGVGASETEILIKLP